MKKRTTLRAAWGLRGLALPAIAALLALFPAGNALANAKFDAWKNVSGAAKIGGPLLDGVSASKDLGTSLKETLSAYPIQTSGEAIILEVVVDGTDPVVLKAIAATGAVVIGHHLDLERARVKVTDSQQLLALAALDAVRYIKPEIRPVTRNGSVTGFGAEAHFADLYTGLPNDLSRGAGVRMGVLSDSFATTPNVFDNDPSNGITTEKLGAGASLTRPLEPGIYTIVVQTPEPGQSVKVFWEIEGVLGNYNSAGVGGSLSGNCTSIVFDGNAVRPDAPIFLLGSGDPQALPGGLVTEIAPANLVGPFRGEGIYPTLGYNTATSQSAASLSCGTGNVSGFRFFTFQLNSVGRLNFSAFSTDDASELALGLRRGCSLSGSEIACVGSNTAGSLFRSKPQQSGDLPEVVFILRDDVPGQDEGAAMAELIYDIAPGADIFFHTAFAGAADFANGIRKLAGLPNVTGALTRGCQIIVDDVGYFTEPFYQVGLIGAAVEEVVNSGVTYFTAAGNSGDQAIRQIYNDIDPKNDDESLLPTGKDLHRWPNNSGFLPVTLDPGASFSAFLYWNQPWQSLSPNLPVPRASEVDLDLYITLTPTVAGIDETISPLGVSEGRLGRSGQGTTGVPAGNAFEFATYTNNTTQQKTVYIAIDHFSGSQGNIPQIPGVPLEFTLLFEFVSGGVKIAGVNDPATGRWGGVASFGHPNHPLAKSVGAVNYFDSPRFGTDNFETNEIDMQAYSSRGGSITTFFDVTGVPRVQTAFKPDFTAVDGNNTTFFGGADFDLDGFPNFFGTSAAAPNAAAIAALMKSLKSDLTPAQIRTAMEETAIDVRGFRAGPGRDDVSGIGLIKADAALEYVANNFGVDGGLPAPRSVSFFNFSGGGGWTFESLDAFTAAGSSSQALGLTLVATNNTNTFGFWSSPNFAASTSLIQNFTTINGNAGQGSLYRVTYRVSSSATDANKTPDFRMRASSRNFEQTTELVVASVGEGLASPKAGEPRFYRQYFTLPENQARFRLYFDLLAFRPEIQAGSSLTVTEMTIESLTESVLLSPRRERLNLFTGSTTSGWTPGSASPVYAPLQSSALDGLVLGPVTNPGEVNFSFWTSPASTPFATLERNKLYRATFRVTSDAAPNAKTDIPTFRLRANSSSGALAALLHIDPKSDSSIVPVAGTSVDYKLFFEAPESLVGERLQLAFDQVHVPGTEANPNKRVRLQSVAVDSFTAPPQ